ncbi:MAG: succinate dehydrogenase, hydrophobic membrane anchor protein [Hyphomicrobiaceae bacterium]|nr:succinate dehydrogenase, hydrophobic membrane anchor protein [Hyphomicrobiaceae bacterium]
MSMRTPLGKVRGLGSAKSGTEHFWQQRITALANVPLMFFLVVVVIATIGADYAQAKALLGSPFVAIGVLAAVVSGLVHMRLGMQVIIEDYIPNEAMKIGALYLNTFATVLIGIACVWAVAKLSFGA